MNRLRYKRCRYKLFLFLRDFFNSLSNGTKLAKMTQRWMNTLPHVLFVRMAHWNDNNVVQMTYFNYSQRKSHSENGLEIPHETEFLCFIFIFIFFCFRCGYGSIAKSGKMMANIMKNTATGKRDQPHGYGLKREKKSIKNQLWVAGSKQG